MHTTLQLDPPAVSINRTALDLVTNDGGIIVDQPGINWGQADIDAFMSNEQRWGSSVVSYRVPNREVTIPLHLSEAGRTALQHKVGLFQREGGKLLRQSQGGRALYVDVQKAALTIPDLYGDVVGLEPNASLVLDCLPDFYGDSIVLDAISAVGENASVLKLGGVPANIDGDYSGRAQITVIEGSGSQQFGLIWAFRGHYYDPAASAKLLWPAATALTPAAGASVSGLSGAHGGQAISQSGIGTSWADIAYLTGSHVGSYQVWARVYSASPGLAFRCAWNIGDRNHGMIAPQGQVALPGVTNFYVLNLGQVRLDPMPGAQQWVAAIQGLFERDGAGTASLDCVYLQPLDEASGTVPGVEPLNPAVLAAGRLNVGWNGVTRAIAGGTSYAPLVPVGDLPRIPPSGLENRPIELLTKMSRGDLATYPDSAIGNYSVVPSYRPSWLGRP